MSSHNGVDEEGSEIGGNTGANGKVWGQPISEKTSLPGRWAAREGQTDHHGQGQVDPNSDDVEVKV